MHILQSKAITLIPPDSWDDKVDRNLMSAFARRSENKSVLALCLSHTSETYHHWRIFTEGKSGVCIVFDRLRLIEAAKQHNVSARPVTYKKIADDRADPVTTARLPFTKRYAFRDEKEFRLVFASRTPDLKLKIVPIQTGMIDEVVLNPWMHDSLAETVQRTLRLIPSYSHLAVRKSQLFDSPYWKRVADA